MNTNNSVQDLCSFYFIFGIMCGILICRMSNEVHINSIENNDM